MDIVYQEEAKKELKQENIIREKDGYLTSGYKQTNTQKRGKGRRRMYGIFVAMHPVKGLIYKNTYMYPKPLKDVIRDYGSFRFMDFVEKTLIDLMDDFGVIEDEKSVNKLLMDTADISINTLDKYMKLLRDNLVFRKINNKKIVINPYQLYKNPAISGYRLWQLQANWEIGKVMTRWFEVTEEDRLEVFIDKAEYDKKWAEEEIKKIKKVRKETDIETKDIVENKDKYVGSVKKFIKVNKIEDFKEYLSKDDGSRHFRNWYLKHEDSPKINYIYQNRKIYAEAFKSVYESYMEERE